MKGIILAMLAGTLFACYQLAVKLSATHIQEMLGAVILQAVAVVVGVLLFFTFRHSETGIVYTEEGIKFAVIAGIFVSLAEIAAFYALAQDISPSVGITLIVGINILVGLGLDYFWFKSALSVSQLLGIALVLIGVILISWKK